MTSPFDLGAETPRSVEEIYRRIRSLGRENERILGDLLAGERRFRRLAKAVWRVQEDERRRLARELHDGIGQTLVALKNQLEGLSSRLSEAPELKTPLDKATELASHALEDTRELSRLLRPPVLDDLGLAAALNWLSRTVGKQFGLKVEREIDGLETAPAKELETVLFRIAQEALTNAAKHAEAKSVRVALTERPRSLVLAVSDDGSGFDVAAALQRTGDRTGVGLRGMRDRVELFGGRLTVDSAPGRGTTVTAEVPLLDSEEV